MYLFCYRCTDDVTTCKNIKSMPQDDGSCILDMMWHPRFYGICLYDNRQNWLMSVYSCCHPIQITWWYIWEVTIIVQFRTRDCVHGNMIKHKKGNLPSESSRDSVYQQAFVWSKKNPENPEENLYFMHRIHNGRHWFSTSTKITWKSKLKEIGARIRLK